MKEQENAETPSLETLLVDRIDRAWAGEPGAEPEAVAIGVRLGHEAGLVRSYLAAPADPDLTPGSFAGLVGRLMPGPCSREARKQAVANFVAARRRRYELIGLVRQKTGITPEVVADAVFYRHLLVVTSVLGSLMKVVAAIRATSGMPEADEAHEAAIRAMGAEFDEGLGRIGDEALRRELQQFSARFLLDGARLAELELALGRPGTKS